MTKQKEKCINDSGLISATSLTVSQSIKNCTYRQQVNTLNKTFRLSQAYKLTAKSYIVAGKLFQNLTNGYGKVVLSIRITLGLYRAL